MLPQSLRYSWNIKWQSSHRIGITLAMCRFTIHSIVCSMVKHEFTHLGAMCIATWPKMTKNEAKQPYLLDLPWAMFPWWSFGPYTHSYLQNIWCNEDPRFCDILHKWNGKQKAWNTTLYQMWLEWFLMVGFLTSIF